MLLAMTGSAFAGKDTVGKMMAEELTGHTTYALASPIKNTINRLFGWDDRHADGVLKEQEVYTKAFHSGEIWIHFYHLLKKDVDPAHVRAFFTIFSPYIVFEQGGFVQYHISPRKAYQLFGTEWGRVTVKDTLWLDMAPTENVIWTDLRFDNEAEYHVEKGGRIICVESDRGTTKETSHVSEKGIDISYVSASIKNYKGTSLNDLREEVKTLCLLMK